MWCGECYTSDLDVLFPVKKKEGFEEGSISLEDKERVQRAWGNKHRAPDEYMVGRNGDHLLIPFECDLCIFRKLRHHEPLATSEQDKLLMAAIRRVSLDAFWSRATSTVLANRDKIKQGLYLSSLVGLLGPYIHWGSMPSGDTFGYEVAVQIVLASRRGGKYSSSQIQWDSARKYRTAYSNHSRASPQANINPLALGDDKGKNQRFVQDGCSSYWFSRFAIGCKNRMGQDWRPNKAMSTELLLAYLESVQLKIMDSETSTEENHWTVVGTYSVITYIVSLRGSEGFLLDLGGLRLHSIDPEKAANHFLIPLMGKVKGEHHDQCHLLPCTFRTESGIKPYEWIQRLIQIKDKQGLIDGPAISDECGRVLNSSTIDQGMHEVLEELYATDKELFPSTIKTKEDIISSYHAFRSFRRSSDTRALNKGLRQDDIDLVNRWHQVEKADGSRPSFDMRHHYAQYELLIDPFLRYTSAM
jgi:hypothetical protein